MAQDAQYDTGACPKCGADIAIGDPLCKACGCAFEWEVEADEGEVETDVSPDGNVCPGCQAPMDADAVLCVACGYHTGLGRRMAEEPPPSPAGGVGGKALDLVANTIGRLLGNGSEEGDAVTVRSRAAAIVDGTVDRVRARMRPSAMDTPMPERGRNLARAAVLVAAFAGTGLLVLCLVSLLTGSNDSGDSTTAQVEPIENAPEQKTTAPEPEPKPKPAVTKFLSANDAKRLAEKLLEADEEEILREVLILHTNARSTLTRHYLQTKLQDSSLSPDALGALCSLGMKMSEMAATDVFRKHLAKIASDQDWDSRWGDIARQLPAPEDFRFARRLARQLLKRRPLPELQERLAALDGIQDEKGGPAAGVPTPTMESLERMRSSVVLVRIGRRLYAGAVIANDKKEATVLTQLVRRPLPGGSNRLPWEVAVREDGKRRWVAASSKVQMEDVPTAFRCLLRFPAVGSLAEATVAVPGPWEGPARFAFCPNEESDPRKDHPLFPMPDQWVACLTFNKASAPVCPHYSIAGALFSGDGRLAGFACRDIGHPPNWERLLAPRASAKGTHFPPDDSSCLIVDFALVDLGRTVTGAVALVTPPGTPEDFYQAHVRYGRNADQPVLVGTKEIPATRGPDYCQVRIENCPPDGSPFLVQLRLDVADGKKRYCEPAVVFPVRTLPARKGMWLGGTPTAGSPRPPGRTPPPTTPRPGGATGPGPGPGTGHTIAASRRQYGGIGIVDLCLQPKALVPDSAHTHFYVADPGGIRRIALADFREAAVLPCPGQAHLLAGNAQGLAAVMAPRTVHLLAPETLVARHRLPLEFEPAHLVGSWGTPLLFVADRDTICVIDTTKPRVIQTLRAADVLVAQEGGKRERFVQLALSPDGKFLDVLGNRTLRRVPIVPGSGLGRAAPPVSLPGKTADPSMLGLPLCSRADGEYIAVGTAVYDLTTTPAEVALTTPASVLAMNAGTGHLLAYAHGAEERFRLLDRRGAMVACWAPQLSFPANQQNGGKAGAFLHPDGRHYLAWDSRGATWIDVGDDLDLRRPGTREGGTQR